MKTHSLVTICAVALTAAVARPAAAQGQQDNTAYGGTTAEFLLLGAGARGAALGGAYAALATDVSALYYNPGGIAQLARPGIMVSTYEYLVDTRYTWLGMAFPMSGGASAFGVHIGNFGFDEQPVTTIADPDGLEGRTYSVSETYVGATYARNFSDRFSAGLTAKLITDRLGTAKGTAFAVDFGTNFHASVGERPIRVSFVIQNLGSNLSHAGQDLDVGVQRNFPLGVEPVAQEPQNARLRTTAWPLPTLFRVGVAFDAVAQGDNRLTVLSEFNQPNNNKPSAMLGAEFARANLGNSGFGLAVRGSYSLSPDNQVGDISFGNLTTSEKDGSFTSDGLALGGGITYGRGRLQVGFDYAWRDLGTIGSANFLSFSLGW